MWTDIVHYEAKNEQESVTKTRREKRGKSEKRSNLVKKHGLKLGGFGVVFNESWGKLSGFLKKLAIFEKGLSRFCHVWGRGKCF